MFLEFGSISRAQDLHAYGAWRAFPSILSVGLTTPEGALISYIRYTGMCKQYKDDRDEDNLLDLYEVEIGVVLDASSLRRPFMRAYCGTELAKVRRFMQGSLKPSVTRVVILPLSRVLLDGLRKKEGCS